MRTAGGHVVVVFGAAVSREGVPRRALVRRLAHALREATADPDAVVVASGGSVFGAPPEAPAMRDWLVSHGLAPDRIVLEPEARSTRENALRSAALLGELGASRVTLVTERFHMRRSLLLMRRALDARGLAGVELRPSPAPDHLEGSEHLTRRMGELFKLVTDLLAWWRGPARRA